MKWTRVDGSGPVRFCPRVNLVPSRRPRPILMLCLLAMVAMAALGALVRIPPAVSLPTFAVLFLLVSVLTLRRLGFDRGLIALVLGGLLLDVVYLGYTGDIERNYDGPEQFRYIGFILDHGRLPPPTHCTICHHPPLYYLVAAGWFKVVATTRLAHPALGLQLLSWVLFSVFIVFAVLTIKQFSRRRRVVWLATALMVFWPYSPINSVRVHNDALVFPLMAATLYFAVRWQRLGSTTACYAAAACAGLSVSTKSSGYVVLLPLVVLLVVLLLRRRVEGQQRRAAAASLLILAGFVMASSADKFGQTQCSWPQCLLGTACDRSSEGPITSRLLEYLAFDLRSFLGQPFLVIHHPSEGGETFWNAFLKSSLFGTYTNFADPVLSAGPYSDLARCFNAVFVGMLLFGLLGGWFAHRERLPGRGVLGLVSIAAVALLVTFRSLCPNPHHADFRHVFALLIPGALFYAECVDLLARRSRLLYFLGFGLALAAMALTVAMFAPVHDWVTRVTSRQVERSLSEHATVREPGTASDQAGNFRFSSNHVLWFSMTPPMTVARLDVSVDHDDVYQVVVVGKGETRRLRFGPTMGGFAGLSRYRLVLQPPVLQAERVALRPLQGDGDYALGHLLVLPAELPSR